MHGREGPLRKHSFKYSAYVVCSLLLQKWYLHIKLPHYTDREYNWFLRSFDDSSMRFTEGPTAIMYM